MATKKIYNLTDLYDLLPHFPKFIETVFSGMEISPDWVQKVSRVKKSMKVLEIGAGHGRFTKLLSKTRAFITSIEPNEHFYESLTRNSVLKAKRNVKFLKAFFPYFSIDRYDYIFLHQNVFLELINQLPGEQVVQHLHNLLVPDGKVILDYIWPFSPKKNKQPVSIYQGEVPGLGRVTYSYSYLGEESKFNHRVELYFKIHRPDGKAISKKIRIKLFVPSWHEVENWIRKAGGKVMKKKLRSHSFFPGKLLLASFRFPQ